MLFYVEHQEIMDGPTIFFSLSPLQFLPKSQESEHF